MSEEFFDLIEYFVWSYHDGAALESNWYSISNIRRRAQYVRDICYFLTLY